MAFHEWFDVGGRDQPHLLTQLADRPAPKVGITAGFHLNNAWSQQIDAFVDHYNIHGGHESSANLTPADRDHVRGANVLEMREDIKERTFRKRRLQHQAATA